MVTTAAWLRARVAAGPVLVVPGAANALSARVVEDVGFEAAYVSGAGIANSFLGAPDIGLVTLSELVTHVSAIRDAVPLPLIVDADTGYGNPVGVGRTVRLLERAGADAIQLEDQIFPKRCGHFGDKVVITREAMVQKIRAAAEARSDPDVLLIARTDARAVEGFDAAIERAQAYASAGADMTFVEAPQSVAEVEALPERLPVPQVINLVHGGRTPMLPVRDLTAFGIALFANAALQGAVKGMQRVLGVLLQTGSLDDAVDDLATWHERQRIVRKPLYDDLERRFAGEGTARGLSSGGAGASPS